MLRRGRRTEPFLRKLAWSRLRDGAATVLRLCPGANATGPRPEVEPDCRISPRRRRASHSRPGSRPGYLSPMRAPAHPAPASLVSRSHAIQPRARCDSRFLAGKRCALHRRGIASGSQPHEGSPCSFGEAAETSIGRSKHPPVGAVVSVGHRPQPELPSDAPEATALRSTVRISARASPEPAPASGPPGVLRPTSAGSPMGAGRLDRDRHLGLARHHRMAQTRTRSPVSRGWLPRPSARTGLRDSR